MTGITPAMQITELTCEYHTNPLGIESAHPRLGWQMQTERRGARQTAYRIRAAADEQALLSGSSLLWDSGRVESDQSIHVPYDGPALFSRQMVVWDVEVWDEHGEPARSGTACWEMGLLVPGDWRAQWIGTDIAGGPRTSAPVPYLRGTFTAAGPVRKARLYITALGLYECVLNGQPVSADVLAPGWTDYHKRVQYQVYDVTGLIQPGANVLGAVLGDGWYCGFIAWRGRQLYGDRPKLLAQLELTLADGSIQTIVTGDDWRYSFGPILESDFLMGESYDARRALEGWDRPGFDDSGWQTARVFSDEGARRVARRGPAVRRMMEIAPVAPPTVFGRGAAARYIFDLGQNMVGWARLRVNGPAGTTVTLRFAEMLNPDGTLYTVNYRSARSTDVYTLRGGGEEVFEPHFTFHGFRYVEISGFPGQPAADAITGVVLHSDMPETGEFSCSDPLLDQLQHNIQWGQRGNFVDVPTDCPQRDERLGWTGDAQVFIRTAAYNRNVAPFFTKWVQDLADGQSAHGQIPMVAPRINPDAEPDGGPAWADAMVICPWTVYLCYGDQQMLAEHYPSIRAYVDHLEEMSLDLIRCHPDSRYENGDWHGFGDWLSIQAETPHDLIGTAFMAYSAHLLSQMAAVLGKQADQARYADLYERTRAAFLRRYVTADGLVASQTQTAYVLALHFDLLPEDQRANAARELVRDIEKRGNHLSTGFVGAPYLPHVLTRAGRNDVAYTLLNQTSWPSWLYSVTQGATTIWERWDGWTHDKGFQDPGMNSFNHYAYGSIGAWMYSVITGLDADPQHPGYKHILLRPQPGGGLSSARAAYQSLYGQIVSDWRIEGDRMTWEVVIPPNTTATLWFPGKRGATILQDGQTIGSVDNGYSIPAGRYVFTIDSKDLPVG